MNRLIILCAIAAAFTGGLIWATTTRSALATDSQTELEAPNVTVNVSTAEANDLTPNVTEKAAGFTWQFLTRESCIDLFLRTCTASFPQPQCPVSNPAGTACAPVGARCWATINAQTVDVYRCR